MYERWGKRALDVVVSSMLLLVTLPVLIVCAVAVWADDGRPVLFRQLRVGRFGVPFVILKFRSMRTRGAYEQGEFAAGDVARVTRTGRWLRATKLDELPQLLNVLSGDMSLVGPRPEVPTWVQQFPERWERVLAVRPGITDWASLRFRREEEELAASGEPLAHYRDEILPRKLALNENYVRDITLCGDIEILVRTATGAFARR